MLGNRILICAGMNLFFFASVLSGQEPVIVDHHSVRDFSSIPLFWINEAKKNLHIAYEHTSHGSQLITGMSLLDKYMGQNGIFIFNNGGLNGALDLRDDAMQSYYPEGEAKDLGYYPDWVMATKNYLDAPENRDVNVILWAWCDLHDSEGEILGEYLPAMEQLEFEYPNVKFVYMTGHSNGGGDTKSVHIWNTVIRNYCISNNKILYDYYDIELYDPNGIYYGNKRVNANCDYDADGDGVRESNWAIQWQQARQENVDWYSCSCSHSQATNCNQKAKAAWYLFARMAGWDGCKVVLGDMNGDCRIDVADFMVLSDNWLSEKTESDWNPVADIAPSGGDGVINIQDFTALSQSWMYTHCGAYFIGDFNQDCRVGWDDLILLTEAWLSETGHPAWNSRCDIIPAGGDDKIDIQDFAALSQEWMQAYCQESFSGDFDQNCRVELDDLILLAAAWLSESGQPDWNQRYDIMPSGGDEKVDFLDLTGLSKDWLKQQD